MRNCHCTLSMPCYHRFVNRVALDLDAPVSFEEVSRGVEA